MLHVHMDKKNLNTLDLESLWISNTSIYSFIYILFTIIIPYHIFFLFKFVLVEYINACKLSMKYSIIIMNVYFKGFLYYL